MQRGVMQRGGPAMLCVVLWLVFGDSGAGAQVAGRHRGLFVGGCTLTHGTSWMLQLDAAGVPTTLRTRTAGPGGAWWTWGNAFGMTMDADNTTVIVPGILGSGVQPLTLSLVRYDPQARAVVGTLWQGVSGPSNLTNWSNVTLDSDGNVITIDNARTPDVVAEYDVFAGVWRHHELPVHRFWNGIGPGAGVGGCEWDEFEGGIRHVIWSGGTLLPRFVYHTSHDFQVTSTASRGSSPGLIGAVVRFGGSLLDDGDWISSLMCLAQPCPGYYLVNHGSGCWAMVAAGTGMVPYDVTHEKYAAPGRGAWLVDGLQPAVYHVDVNTVTLKTVYAGTGTTMPGLAYEVLPLYDRDLGSRRTGKATWDLFINPGDGMFSRKPYLIAASLAPARPGVCLPDGREVYLGVDPLVVATLAGPLPPCLTGNSGTLDARGRGRARIDCGPLGTAANGTVVHFCGLILDTQAPSGIAWVCDPHAFVIDVWP